ncbi:MAG: phage head-tail connector protein [Nitrospinae bacterium]|nr:phage head-tail connector protein [Nitrospinota bacterium]
MSLKLKTAPASEPVSLADAKSYLRISDAGDDALITALISAARRQCERYTGRALIDQTWTLWLDADEFRARVCGTPGDDRRVWRGISLAKPPLQTVSFVKTYDPENTPATFDAANYLVDAVSEPGRIALKQGAAWPASLRETLAVEVEFVAGYGAATAVPDPLKQGLLLLIKLLFADKSKLFETDESQGLTESNRLALPPAVKHLWETYRVNFI